MSLFPKYPLRPSRSNFEFFKWYRRAPDRISELGGPDKDHVTCVHWPLVHTRHRRGLERAQSIRCLERQIVLEAVSMGYPALNDLGGDPLVVVASPRYVTKFPKICPLRILLPHRAKNRPTVNGPPARRYRCLCKVRQEDQCSGGNSSGQ